MSLQQQYSGPVNQAWLAFWVSHHPDSLLARYLEKSLPFSPPALTKQPGIIMPPREREEPRAARPEPRAVRRAKREARSITDVALSDWAKRLLGDQRISGITLQDILDGLEDYFEVFRNLRKVDADAYKFFSRVGAPIVLRNTAAWRDTVDTAKILNAKDLPNLFGAFFSKSKEEVRREAFDDKCDTLEFWCFHKKSIHNAAVSPGTTVFAHNMVGLDRSSAFTADELKKYPWMKKNFGMGWLVGVLPDGAIKALPFQMSRRQQLPGGGSVHHSSFQIPEILSKWGNGDPHELVRRDFTMALAFAAATTMTGIQVAVKKDKVSVRFSIPITSLKTFFADRDSPDGGRRKAIIHLRLPHQRQLPNGKIAQVGEHLAGERQFQWRGYEISVGVPGIHFASPEGFNMQAWEENDPAAPEGAKLISVGALGKKIGKAVWKSGKSKFRHGKPAIKYNNSTIPDEHPV